MSSNAPTDEELNEVMDRISIPTPALSGDLAAVTFTIHVNGAFTPQDAVNSAMSRMLRLGTDAAIFEVTDDDETKYLVRGAATFDPTTFPDTLDDMRDLIRRHDEQDGEDA